MTRVRTLAAALLALAAPAALRAQSSVPGAAAKAAAMHAVAATDAHTDAMSAPGASPAASSERPSRMTPIVRSDVPAARPAPRPAVAQARTPTAPSAPSSAQPARRPGSAAPAATPSAPPTDTGATPTGKGVMSFRRETFSYVGGGRRDPFTSLLRAGGDLRPLISDLRLVTIVYDATGRNSVAILRDLTTKEQYRVRVGQTLGRMRVAQIQPREIVFTIEEFGYSRQETLMYNDPNSMRPK